MANVNQTQMGYPTGDIGRVVQPVTQYPYNNYMVNPVLPYNYGRTPSNVQTQFLKCRPVSSREEAIASQIDLDGSLWVFPNVGNGKIYTKQINNDGTATFNTYSFTEEQIPKADSVQYVTKQEFNKVVQSLVAAIQPKEVKEPAPAPITF